jgi:hypothetical protein
MSYATAVTMRLLHAGNDIAVIALWLGHFSGVAGLSRCVRVSCGEIVWLSVLLPIVRCAPM